MALYGLDVRGAAAVLAFEVAEGGHYSSITTVAAAAQVKARAAPRSPASNAWRQTRGGIGMVAMLVLPVAKRAMAGGQYPIGDQERWRIIVESLGALVQKLDKPESRTG
jgi:hypothetical protein